jgi:hypothetical protein
MNGKVARRLRRIATNLTKGKPLAEYNTQPVPSIRHKVSERTELVPECTRAAYLDLKNEYKKNTS